MMVDSLGQLGSSLPEKGGASAHAYLVDCTYKWRSRNVNVVAVISDKFTTFKPFGQDL